MTTRNSPRPNRASALGNGLLALLAAALLTLAIASWLELLPGQAAQLAHSGDPVQVPMQGAAWRATSAGQELPPPAPPGLIITPHANLPDPFVLRVHGTYYLYASQTSLYHFGTKIPTPNLPVLWGPSLTDLGPVHDAMPVMPAWAETGWNWAPDVRRLGPHDYVMWFSALIKNHSALLQKCIGAATATSPKGPFVGQPKPLICQLNQDGSIDPRSYMTKSGHLWMIWKSDNNADVNAPSHTFIYSQRLAPNGLSLIGPRYRLLTADQPWEGRIVEAPQMVHAGGAYWLFFSGNWFNSSWYAIGVAKCAGLTGPCWQPFSRPLIHSDREGQGPGEASLFHANGSWWIVYAPWSVNFHRKRPVAILQVHFAPWGPSFARPTWEQVP